MPHPPCILGIIPARSGSRRIPRKNLVPLLGKPLLVYTCEAARASTRLTRCMLSTDDEEIAGVAKTCGIEVPFLRPKDLAQDETPMLDVLHHALSELHTREKFAPDAVVLLQPTSPLRTGRHIDDAVHILLSTDANTVVSVCEVPHQFAPSSLMVLDDGHLLPYEKGPMILRRQDKPMLYARNGPAVLAVRTEPLLKQGFYGGDVRPFLMDQESSVDIDDVQDVAYAEFLLQRRHAAL